MFMEDIARERVWPASQSEEIRLRQERFGKYLYHIRSIYRLISAWPTGCHVHVTCVSDLMTLLANSRLDHEYKYIQAYSSLKT